MVEIQPNLEMTTYYSLCGAIACRKGGIAEQS
jgi:hypothetical protein